MSVASALVVPEGARRGSIALRQKALERCNTHPSLNPPLFYENLGKWSGAKCEGGPEWVLE